MVAAATLVLWSALNVLSATAAVPQIAHPVTDVAGVLSPFMAFAGIWFLGRERFGRIGFYVLFAVMVTAAVQLVGVYLVFTSLIVPAVATYRYAPNRQLAIGYGLAIASYVVGLAISVVTDLPSSPVIVWTMALLGLVVHLLGNHRSEAVSPG